MSSRNVPQAADARVSVLMVLADSGADALDAARRALAAPQCSELIVLTTPVAMASRSASRVNMRAMRACACCNSAPISALARR